ncbi:hypothetical protein ACWT_5848 [Actinoplanes sp. SE50]|nr:hypothetical protein ACPL_5979 [Actinoplanes sp. SE50/110]ATO85263.1 hypothetical protein ACWT_5848 [Actinoplanes sp. SE50]SLM02673.1 hypothetical protein ACSP50_5955 [Actinoplanes sp. SE50/110]
MDPWVQSYADPSLFERWNYHMNGSSGRVSGGTWQTA